MAPLDLRVLAISSSIARTENMSAQHFHEMVNFECSLLGMSETSSDIRAPLEREARARALADVAIEEMMFVGDALFPGGTTIQPSRRASIQVKDPNETKRVVETVVACLRVAAPTSVTPTKSHATRTSN